MANLVKFLNGTKAAYSNLGTYDESTLYFIQDTQELYKGELAIGNNHVTGTAGNIVAVGAEGEGLVGSNYQIVNTKPETTLASSSVPTVALVTEMIGEITSGAVTGVSTSGDSYITISGGKTADTSQIIEIKVSAKTGDVASDSLAAGLVADAKNVHDYIDTVSGNLVVAVSDGETTSGYLKTYEIKQGGNVVGKIDIPKDFVVRSASVKTCAEKDKPITGLNVGDKYLDLEVNVQSGQSATTQHVYLAAKDLGADYGAGEHIKIAAGADGKTKINVSGITTDGTGVTSASTDLTEGKAVYEFVKSEIITGVTFAGNDYIGVNANLTGQDLALTAQPTVASASADIESATTGTHKLVSDNAVKQYVDAKTQAHNAYTTITINGDNGTTSSQSASTSASTATVTFGAASAATAGSFIGVKVDSTNKVTTTVNVATTAAEVSGATADNLVSTLAVQQLMTWGTIPGSV